MPLPDQWPSRFLLKADDVWSAFFLYALILDHEEQRAISNSAGTLELPHEASSQAERIRSALRIRNSRIVGIGQEYWAHACNLCCWVSVDDTGVKRK